MAVVRPRRLACHAAWATNWGLVRIVVTVMRGVTGRNEAFGLEVYCLGLLFVLQNFIDPTMYRDLARLHRHDRHDARGGPAQTRRAQLGNRRERLVVDGT